MLLGIERTRGRTTSTNNDDNGNDTWAATGEEWSQSVAKADHHMVPQVIFTDPQVASVGLTEREAKDLGLKTRMVDSEIGEVDGAQLKEDGYVGHAKLIIDEDKNVIVGATFLGPEISDLLHAATVAIVGGVPLTIFGMQCRAFPRLVKFGHSC